MKNKQYSATVRIGAALESSVKKRIGVVQAGLKGVGDEIRNVKSRQKELERQRDTLIKEGKAVDHLDREYEELSRTLAGLERGQRRWMNVSNASVNVGKKFGAMKEKIGRLARTSTIAVTGLSASIFALSNSTATAGDNAAKTADKLGIQIGALQELRYAAERSGVSASMFDNSLQRMTRRLSEAALGSGEAAKALEELGLDAGAVASMSPDEALSFLSDELLAVGNQSDRVRLAFQLFGREGVGMVNMLKDGSKGLRQLRRDARATGNVLSDQSARDAEAFKDALQDAEYGIAGFKNTIGAALMPVVTDLFKQFSGWMRKNRAQVIDFSNRLATGFRKAVPIIGKVVSGVQVMAGKIGTLIGKAAELVGGFDNLGMIAAGLFVLPVITSVLSFGSALGGLFVSVVKLVGVLPSIATGIKAIGLAVAANPLGLLITGIVTVGVLIYKYWHPIKGFVVGFFSGLSDALRPAVGWLTSLGERVPWLGKLFKGIGSFVSDAVGWFSQLLTPVDELDDSVKNATEAGRAFGQWYGRLLSRIATTVGDAIGALKTVFDWSPLGQLINNWSKVTDFFSGIRQKIVGAFDGLPELLSEKIGAVGDMLGGASDFFGFGDDESGDTVTPRRGSLRPVAGSALPVMRAKPVPESLSRSQQPVQRANITDQRTIDNSSVIQVYAQPGQSPREIAEEVERLRSERAESVLFDTDTDTDAGGLVYG